MNEIIEESENYYRNSKLLIHDSTAYLLYLKYNTNDQIVCLILRKQEILTTLNSMKDRKNVSFYPNPFSQKTRICFSLPDSKYCIVQIINIYGEILKEDIVESVGNGKYQYSWDGTNRNEERVISGLYFIKFTKFTTKENILFKVLLIN